MVRLWAFHIIRAQGSDRLGFLRRLKAAGLDRSSCDQPWNRCKSPATAAPSSFGPTMPPQSAFISPGGGKSGENLKSLLRNCKPEKESLLTMASDLAYPTM